MLNKNSFAIMSFILGTIFAVNIFGQSHPDFDRLPTIKKNNKQEKTANMSMGEPRDFDFDLIRNKSPRQTANGQAKGIVEVYETKGMSINSPRDISTGQVTERKKGNQSLIDTSSGEIVWAKSTPDLQNSSRSKSTNSKQEKLGNFEIQLNRPKVPAQLGDTATHEVGHKQRKRGKS